MKKLEQLDKKILKILKKHPKGIRRCNICKLLNFTKYTYFHKVYGKYSQTLTLYNQRTTIYNHLENLEIEGKVIRFKLLTGSQGKPFTLWKLAYIELKINL